MITDNLLVSLIAMAISFGCLLAILTFVTLQLFKSWKLYMSDKKYHAIRLLQTTRSNRAKPLYIFRDRGSSFYDTDFSEEQNMVKLPITEGTDYTKG